MWSLGPLPGPPETVLSSFNGSRASSEGILCSHIQEAKLGAANVCVSAPYGTENEARQLRLLWKKEWRNLKHKHLDSHFVKTEEAFLTRTRKDSGKFKEKSAEMSKMTKVDSLTIYHHLRHPLFCHSTFPLSENAWFFFICIGIYLLIYGNKTRTLDEEFKILE